LDLSTSFSTNNPPFQLENFGDIGPLAGAQNVNEQSVLYTIDLSSSSPTWKKLSDGTAPNAPSSRRGARMVFNPTDQSLYVWGGAYNGSVLNDTDFYIYGINKNSWFRKASPNPPEARALHTMTILPNGYIFILGGIPTVTF
ncbi:6023_t:CDS:2, partial [Racocetra fulgida]